MIAGLILALTLDSALAANRCEVLFSIDQVKNKNFSYVLTRSTKGDVKATVTPAENLNFNQKLPTKLQAIYNHFFSQDPKAMAARIDKITYTYGGKMGMGFNKKNDKGDASIPFHVRANPTPVFIPESYHNDLVKSSAPMMRSMRLILQLFYSKKDVTVEDLKKITVANAPESALEAFRSYVYENIYFEKALVHPSMKDYPFASIAGIDHAMTTLSKMLPLAFEINGGTPSGLSNTKQLIELFKKEFPEYAKDLEQYLADDNTFQNLAAVLKDLGKSWTGQDGISVILSPGRVNGAHPDVVSIAELSGNHIQLATTQDLYVDKEGWVRLNIGAGKAHPLVTTIYSRIEESALYSNMSQKKYGDGIGFKNPHLASKEELQRIQASSQKLRSGAQLKEGVQYQFIKDKSGTILDVKTDATGNPIVEAFEFAKFGKDPSRSAKSQAEPDLISLLQNRRIVLTNVGGRTLDIKPLFALMADYFAPRHNSENLPALLGPPQTLNTTAQDPAVRQAEYKKFFANPRGFVVKVAAESGGQGIYIGSQLSDADVKNVAGLVRKDMEAPYPQLTIQELLTPAVYTTVFDVEGAPTWTSAIPDFRVFLFMDSKGEVKSGPTGYLGRAGGYASASANTSQGGQYFIPMVVKEGEKPAVTKKGTVAAAQPHLTASDLQTLDFYLGNIGEFRHLLNQNSSDAALIKLGREEKGIDRLSRSERAYMEGRGSLHLLGPKYRSYLATLEGFGNGTVSASFFRAEIEKMIEQLKEEKDFPYQGIQQRVKYWLVDWVQYN